MLLDDLTKLVLNYSLAHIDGYKEYDLMTFIGENSSFFSGLDESNTQNLFKKHFLIKHALYCCEPLLRKKHQLQLDINNVWINFAPIDTSAGGPVTNASITTQSAHDALRDFYLNWDNFFETSESELEGMLDAFWKRFFNVDKRDDALSKLGLENNATQVEIKQRYRTLASNHHPDKGGDAERFIEIRSAYESLKESST